MKYENVSGSCRDACVSPSSSGFHQPVSWKDRGMVDARAPIRIGLNFRAIRPEDAKLYAMYVEEAS